MWGWWKDKPVPRKAPHRGLLEHCGWQRVEDLELRYLLSASSHHHDGGKEQVETASASEPRKKTHEPKYMDVSGTWNYVVHVAGADITGTLVLQQHGKKVTGTLTHDQQPPGEVKLKLLKSNHKANSQPFNGKIKDFSVESQDVDTDGEFEDEDDDGRAESALGHYEDEDADWDAEHSF